MSEFYDTKEEELTFVPFDIETTGFKSAEGDYVTTFILFQETDYHIWINTSGEKVSGENLNQDVIDRCGFDNIILHICRDEKELLEEVGSYLDSPHIDNSTILTAFNGETFKGNTDFDVPFLRTRCFRTGVNWILDGLWYADIYEVFTESSRFDTTVKAEPSLDSMKKSDLQQFIDDVGFNINYEMMYKSEIVRSIRNHNSVSSNTISQWSSDNDIPNISDVGDLKKSQLETFIDDKSIDISYENLSKDDLVREIRERDYNKEMLVNWHNNTGRSIGTTEATTLDSIHKSIIEDKKDDEGWVRSLPFDLEVFEPFDPFQDSGEAVTAYMSGEFSDVILHCLADVARTVNLNRVMSEYAPKKDYSPKVL